MSNEWGLVMPDDAPIETHRDATMDAWEAAYSALMPDVVQKRTMQDFIRRDLGSHLWSKQDEIVESVQHHARTSVRSCHAAGKSHLASRIAIAYLNTNPNSIVVTTAPTNRQVEYVIWRYMRTAHRNALRPLPGRMLSRRYDIAPGWYAVGFKGSDSNTDAIQGFHCFDEEHEILTRRGWLGIDEIDEADVVLSVPVNGEQAEWMPVTSVHRYEYDGDLNVYEGRSASFAVTDNHRFPAHHASAKVGTPYRLREFRDLPEYTMIRRRSGWAGTPIEVPEPFAKYGLSAEQFAELVGFWIGDGGMRPRHDGYTNEVIFYQSKDDGGYLAEMLAPFKTFRGRDYTAFSDHDMAVWLRENVGAKQLDRRVPRMLLDAPTPVLHALRRGFWAAEGDSHEYGQAYNSNAKLMDDMQEVLIKLGNPGTIGVNTPAGVQRTIKGVATQANNACLTMRWRTPTKSDGVSIRRSDVQRVPYKGRVWCVSTPYQTFYTRRKGRVMLSGNSSDLLVIVDEAAGVSEQLLVNTEAILTGVNARLLMIGNPTSTAGMFRRSFHEDQHLYSTVTISAWETPNFTTFGITRQDMLDGTWQGKVGDAEMPYPALIDPMWVERQFELHGPDSPFVQSRIDAIFPLSAEDTLVPLAWIEAAMAETTRINHHDKQYVGIDVARSGMDETVLCLRQGNAEVHMEAWTGFDLMESVGKIRFILSKYGFEEAELRVDVIGLGAGLADRLRELGYWVVDINVAASSSDKTQWRIFRHEGWWQLAEFYREGLIWPAEGREFDPLMISQLSDIRRVYNSTYTKPMIEEKDAMKKRTGRSPDRAEAQMLAFCTPPRGGIKFRKLPNRSLGISGSTTNVLSSQ